MLLAPSCAARQAGPEIVGVEHETRIGGSGVVSATDELVDRTTAAADRIQCK